MQIDHQNLSPEAAGELFEQRALVLRGLTLRVETEKLGLYRFA